jgi:hypothetical protein
MQNKYWLTNKELAVENLNKKQRDAVERKKQQDLEAKAKAEAAAKQKIAESQL